MLPAKLTRVAHRTSPAAIISSANATTSRSHHGVGDRSSHQRRHSSSKASWPPDNSAGSGKPAPAAKSETAAEEAASRKPPTADPRGGKKLSKPKRPRSITVQRPQDHFAGLPSVPQTPNLHPSDILLSSFFSQHRPLSLEKAIPPPVSNEDFNAIFESRSQGDAWENGNSAEGRPEDVIYTLQNTIEHLDSRARGRQPGFMRLEVVQDGPRHPEGVKHLDGTPQLKNLEELVAQFLPFKAPPPPQKFSEDTKSSDKKRAGTQVKLQTSTSQRAPPQSRSKSYATTIVVTESTGADGQRTFTASSSPIVRIADPEDPHAAETPLSLPSRPRTLSQERRLQRQRDFWLARPQPKAASPSTLQRHRRIAPTAKRPKMILISVRRQRKLKMKKHKYKKLMKRTRNLRRRQEKI